MVDSLEDFFMYPCFTIIEGPEVIEADIHEVGVVGRIGDGALDVFDDATTSVEGMHGVNPKDSAPWIVLPLGLGDLE